MVLKIFKTAVCPALMFFMFIAYGVSTAFGQDSAFSASQSEKIDAILLLDSSGSMLMTDPKRLTDEGAKLFIQSLGEGDRIGVIEFADRAKVVHDLSDYNSNQEKIIFDKIAGIKNTGLYTDLLSGIKLAKEVLKSKGRPDASQVIVLFSDGKMEPDPAVATEVGRTKEMFDTYLPELKSLEIKVHTLAFSDLSDQDMLAQIAASTDGISMFTPDADLIHQSFTSLFLAVKKPQVLPLTSKGFKIDADVQEATFYINREGATAVTITSPGGRRLREGFSDQNTKWFRSQKFDVVTISEPEAGDWLVSGMVAQDGFATLLTNLKLVTDWPTVVNAEDEVLLQARLYESDKPVVLHEMSESLDYAFQIVPTDKIAEPVVRSFLRDDGKEGDKVAGDGTFSAKVKINDPGQYMLKVVAHSPTFDRYQHLPFRVKQPLVRLSVSQSKETIESQDAKEDLFIAELSTEAMELKNLEIKILAVDRERNRYLIDMQPGSDHRTYQLAASVLPSSGLYEIEAVVSGVEKNNRSTRVNSKRIQYTLEAAGAEVKIVAIEKPIEKEKEEEKPSGESPVWPYLLFAVIGNLLAAAGVFVLFKKAGSGPKIAMPDFENLENFQNSLAALRDKTSLSEIDFSDPAYENLQTEAAEQPAPEALPDETEPDKSEAKAAPDAEVAAESSEGAVVSTSEGKEQSQEEDLLKVSEDAEKAAEETKKE